MRLKITQSMRGPVAILVPAGLQKGVRIIEDEAGRAAEMPCLVVVDRPIIEKMLEETAGRVEDVRLIKGQDVLDMRAQETGRGEIGMRCLGHVYSGFPMSASIPSQMG